MMSTGTFFDEQGAMQSTEHYVLLYKLYAGGEARTLSNCWVGLGLYDDPDTALLHGKEVCANTQPGNILVCELQKVWVCS